MSTVRAGVVPARSAAGGDVEGDVAVRHGADPAHLTPGRHAPSRLERFDRVDGEHLVNLIAQQHGHQTVLLWLWRAAAEAGVPLELPTRANALDPSR